MTQTSAVRSNTHLNGASGSGNTHAGWSAHPAMVDRYHSPFSSPATHSTYQHQPIGREAVESTKGTRPPLPLPVPVPTRSGSSLHVSRGYMEPTAIREVSHSTHTTPAPVLPTSAELHGTIGRPTLVGVSVPTPRAKNILWNKPETNKQYPTSNANVQSPWSSASAQSSIACKEDEVIKHSTECIPHGKVGSTHTSHSSHNDTRSTSQLRQLEGTYRLDIVGSKDCWTEKFTLFLSLFLLCVCLFFLCI